MAGACGCALSQMDSAAAISKAKIMKISTGQPPGGTGSRCPDLRVRGGPRMCHFTSCLSAVVSVENLWVGIRPVVVAVGTRQIRWCISSCPRIRRFTSGAGQSRPLHLVSSVAGAAGESRNQVRHGDCSLHGSGPPKWWWLEVFVSLFGAAPYCEALFYPVLQ